MEREIQLPKPFEKEQGQEQEQTIDVTQRKENHSTPKTQVRQGIRWERGPKIGQGTYGTLLNSVQIGSAKTACRELFALKSEVSILRELDHPHIVKYIYTDAAPEESRVDILLEYVPGGSLSSLLKKFGRFNDKITKIYLRQILDAVIFMHNKGIIHRDLKCANILINNDASIRVSDFGASTKLSKNEKTGNYKLTKSLKGSPYWLAPEIALRKGHDLSADIWSFG